MKKIEWNRSTKLSEKKALYLTWQLWEWLAKTDDQEKSSWSHWKANNGQVDHCLNHCPCCEFAAERKGPYIHIDCQKCPLFKLWNKGGGNVKLFPCEDAPNSPYIKWAKLHSPFYSSKSAILKRRGYAKTIANYARRRYHKLTKKGGKSNG